MNLRIQSFIAGLVAMSAAFALLAVADEPNKQGGYAPVPGMSAADRARELKEYLLKRDGYSASEASNFVLSHRIPLCLGGSNDIGNLWLQPIGQAQLKARLESEKCRLVQQGKLSHEQAMEFFQSGEWETK